MGGAPRGLFSSPTAWGSAEYPILLYFEMLQDDKTWPKRVHAARAAPWTPKKLLIILDKNFGMVQGTQRGFFYIRRNPDPRLHPAEIKRWIWIGKGVDSN